MPFEICELSGNKIIKRHPIKLAGYNFVYHLWNNLGQPENGWVAQNAFIIKELKEKLNTINEPKILITTMNYNFFVEEIWGWTYKDGAKVLWTPLLFVGREVEIDDEIKIHNSYLYQFMYFQGDDGGWNFGAGGPNTSPLLFNDSFDWFRRAIKDR